MRYQEYSPEDTKAFKPVQKRLEQEYGYSFGNGVNYQLSNAPWAVVLRYRDEAQTRLGRSQAYDHVALLMAMERYDLELANAGYLAGADEYELTIKGQEIYENMERGK